ncbi:restriction endonuclease subunit S [Corynebacterium diphtheriae]|uniref:restriction endonuclease subunit S n=1 Tax=Corynebacterium diphtheriae TaxID=1717 RepID=UPI0002469513|nr:restriction endonuclease subunit S [Corynebacterium diphtheriae]AEX84386.1 type I restriction enzyme, S subunit [Corynebacterium diphtheriae VA01]OWM43224.1 hypothetical protein BU164_09285 [Corynebacterium diphtheriae]OWM48291.1 hypothetical protein BU163_09665 [Corynebacterium diphtheriae]OWN43610.1 hypothetical protein AY507_07330 [Corynebacterium diphtheriae bv. mitis]OWN64687.1 hypothetical protein AY521_08940 [Corynebacterium diphtheriae bv. mitis]
MIVTNMRGIALPEGWDRRPIASFSRAVATGLTTDALDVNGTTPLFDAQGQIGNTNSKPIDAPYVTIIKDGAGVGKVRILPKNSTFLGTMNGLITDTTVDLKYFYYVLAQSSFFLENITTIPHIYFRDYSKEKILVPPRARQSKIVNFLDLETAKIDHLIAKQRQLVDLTNSRLQAWREHAFWGNGHGNPLECPPEGWELVRNRHVLEHVDGRSETGEEEMLSVSHLTGVTPRSMKNVTMFEAESTVGYRLVGQDELVINTMWAWMGALGVSRYEGIVSPAYDVYKFRDLDAVNPMYFDCMYRTAAYVQLMKANSRGIWESRLRLYPEVFLRLPSLVPPKETQDRLVNENCDRTTEAGRLTTQGNKAIELLQERRSALITAAVTGQIEV